jgi:hypothetical protein
LDKKTIEDYNKYFTLYHDKIWDQDECTPIAYFFDIDERLERINKLKQGIIVSANND